MARSAVAVRRGRRLAESLMVDTCTITKPGEGERVLDPVTNKYTDPPRVTVYSGKCRLQVTSTIAGSSSSTAGERVYVVQDAELQLPVVGSEAVAVSHVAHMDSAVNDTALVGREFTVAARHEKTHATSRRLRVEEATG